MDTQELEKVVSVVKKSEVDEVLDNWRKANAEDGRKYPPEFLDELIFKAHNVVVNWIKQHQLPKQLSDLLDEAYCLRMAHERALSGKLEDLEAGDIPSTVQDIIVHIMELGGTFYDEMGTIDPSMPADWKPKE